MLDLDAIEARAEAATEGPWTSLDGRSHIIHAEEGWIAMSNADRSPYENADFIANARTDIPALVAELRAAREVVKAAQQRRAKGAPDHPIWRDFDATLAAYRAVVGPE